MLSSLSALLESSTLWYPRYWGELCSLAFTQDRQQAQNLFQRAVDVRRRVLAKADWSPWLAEHELSSLSVAYTRLFLCAYFRRAVPEDLQAAVKTQPVKLFVPEGDTLRISRLWMAACEQEFAVQLVAPGLLTVRPLPKNNQDYADIIHNLHRTTYSLLPLAGLTPSFSSLYRGAIPKSDPLQLKGELGKFPQMDYTEIRLGSESHVRCCSLTPHACENYDLTPPRASYFVLGRGMEDVGADEACVLPTVLFSTNAKVPNRFKGSSENLILLAQDRLKVFFRLFEVPLG